MKIIRFATEKNDILRVILCQMSVSYKYFHDIFYEKLPLNLMKKRWKRCEKSLLSCEKSEKKYSYVQIEYQIIDKDKIEYE